MVMFCFVVLSIRSRKEVFSSVYFKRKNYTLIEMFFKCLFQVSSFSPSYKRVQKLLLGAMLNFYSARQGRVFAALASLESEWWQLGSKPSVS